MTESFDDICRALEESQQEKTEYWVELRTSMKICLVGIQDLTNQVFFGKYYPCVDTAKKHEVPYSKIESIIGNIRRTK
jgi:hypothetical protein